MNEDKLNQQARRGERAERIYNDEIVQEAFDAIEETIISAWRTSRADQDEERDNAYLMLRLFENFKHQFLTAIATGKAARKELLAIKDPSRVRSIFNVR